VPVCEADGVAGAQAQVVAIEGDGWHAQVGAVDLFLRDASFDPPLGEGGSDAAGELRVPFNGKVIAVHAQPGYTVRKGDTLVTVADRFGVSVAQLRSWNRLTSTRTVAPGKVLYVSQPVRLAPAGRVRRGRSSSSAKRSSTKGKSMATAKKTASKPAAKPGAKPAAKKSASRKKKAKS